MKCPSCKNEVALLYHTRSGLACLTCKMIADAIGDDEKHQAEYNKPSQPKPKPPPPPPPPLKAVPKAPKVVVSETSPKPALIPASIAGVTRNV